ncbi:MAG: hypothetical protein K8I82_32220 [Anaerolineae bacterium]|nr:hypothetical protein [Anaerolineae bacterium]
MNKYIAFAVWVGNVLIPDYEEHLGFVCPEEADPSGYHLIADERWPELEIYYSDYVRNQFEAKKPGEDFITAVKENAGDLLAQMKSEQASQKSGS